MSAPRGVLLTGAEVAQLRRCLLTVERQATGLREAGDTPDPPETSRTVARRLEEAAAGIRYLLDQAEARRGVH